MSFTFLLASSMIIGACTPLSAHDLLNGTPIKSNGVQINAAYLAHRLDSDLQPVETALTFTPEDSIYLSLSIQGQPKTGIISARFFYGNQYLGGSSIDLAASSNWLHRIGQQSQAAFVLNYPQPLLISPYYSLELFINDQLVGDFSFQIQAPADAIPTKVEAVLLAKDVNGSIQPLDPQASFTTTDTVYLFGQGDFGRLSWLQAEWYIGDELVQECINYLSLPQNYSNERFLFQCALDEGWPIGTHSIVLVVNDAIITRVLFTVQ